jgi:hypothetical protein
MLPFRQTAQDLLNHLKDQIEFLARSAKQFDQGILNEGKRLAVPIRLLVHDTDNSVSLLKLLNKKSMLFHDTSLDYHPGNMLPTLGLIMISTGSGHSGYVAPLDNLAPPRVRPKVTFDTWWNKVVFVVGEIRLTRRDLVLAIANKDGGAHVDPELDRRYAEISRYNAIGWRFFVNGVEQEFTDPVLVSLRQISHEILISLKEEFPDLLDWAAL